jgi:hypothetical protein
MGTTKIKKPTEVIIAKIIKPKKLQRIDWKLRIMWEPTSGANLCAINKKILKRNSNLEIMFYGFPREKKHI